MTFHPREQRFGRREFIGRTALGALALSGAGGLLSACGGGDSGADSTLQLARPDRPVTLPLFDDNPAIASGLSPEAGPLRIYNWVSYLWKAKIKEFEKEYGVRVELTTFSTMDEAITKLTTGGAEFDVFFPTPDRMSRLATGKVLQPLNRSYIPNLEKTIWPALQDPFYDQGSQYTVPYVTYTTGIGYRKDKLKAEPGSLANPYEIFWEGGYKGKTWLLDDAREAISMVLLKNGNTDLNTEDRDTITKASDELIELIDLVNVKVSTEDYTKVPEGEAWIHQAWSGSMVAAPYYLPKGTSPDTLGYWYPPEGGGAIGSDTMAVLRSAKSPVLAHHFLNFMLDDRVSYENFSWVGYQPPLKSINPERLVTDEIIPPNLAAAVVRESDFVKGYQELELSPAGAKVWQDAWAAFKAGG